MSDILITDEMARTAQARHALHCPCGGYLPEDFDSPKPASESQGVGNSNGSDS